MYVSSGTPATTETINKERSVRRDNDEKRNISELLETYFVLFFPNVESEEKKKKF